jgi:DNA-binding response OmpR family regulator
VGRVTRPPQNRGVEAMNPARKRVLIADCHEDVLIALEKILEDEGFDVTTVWTAKDALDVLDSEVLDLVLVNEYLPDAVCADILKALRQRGVRIPCIVMQPSAPEISDLANLQSLGATNIVCKYGYHHIVDVVNECLADSKKDTFVA